MAENRGDLYNPLDRANLAWSVERAMLARPLSALPPPVAFRGAGLYAIYYVGDFPAYQPITPPARREGEVPIYVGRAIPRGARAGVGGLLATTAEPVLLQRLSQHARSIEQVRNLKLRDFRCRYLVVDDIWVPLAEALLIALYQPVWNQVLQGFGNHDPGAGRRRGARPDWDEVHPGRLWAAKQEKPGRTSTASLESIAQHLGSFAPPDLDVTPPVTRDAVLVMEDEETGQDADSTDTSPPGALA